MTAYMVCHADEADQLAAMVCEYLRDGWALAGGLAISATFYPSRLHDHSGWIEGETRTEYAQALTKEI